MSYLLDFRLSEIATNRVYGSDFQLIYPNKKKDFLKPFVVLVLRCRKIEKD